MDPVRLSRNILQEAKVDLGEISNHRQSRGMRKAPKSRDLFGAINLT